ncbi:endolytic transglycosylase MltG [Nocardioides sp. SYSU D00038]|uniref:endolytic transglycosylase MltG n=1 Tax=Nocardioides sp. SYSU D00038 TaxID=2812554 RepID=UPI001967255D|nr:endolytic transglycosylase MltG [Nocardioides sp. SYSU D00038]
MSDHRNDGYSGSHAAPYDQTHDVPEDDYDDYDDYGHDDHRDGGRRAGRRRRSPLGCLVALVVLALVLGALYVGATKGLDAIRDAFGEPEDYPGPGSGEVTVEVVPGDSSAAIGRKLKSADVVASVDAFISAAQANPASSRIQPGFYLLKEQMKAADALDVLIDPGNTINTQVTIPEGLQVKQIVDILVEKTGFKKARFERVLGRPDALGLPDYAGGNAEGYLFPATYAFAPGAKPDDMLREMVARWRQSAEEAQLEQRADRLGYTPHEVMTIASMLEAEGRGDDMVKISRAIYNRLEIDPNPTAGFLQIDATVNFALGRSGTTAVTEADIDSVADSPWNTYRTKGLPPGPIEAPGDAAIEAALSPAKGPWFFWVTVNLETGETKFTDDYDEFLQFKQEYQEYCETQSDRC